MGEIMEGRNDWKIRRYSCDDYQLWNEAVAEARNATFLFYRDYMDYHADRFKDFSLIAFHPKRKPLLLPANITAENVLHSHQGLSYGGWIIPLSGFDSVDFCHVWDSFIAYCGELGIKGLDYKPLPFIYHKMPSQDDLYHLFKRGAKLCERTLSSVIDLEANPGFSKTMRRYVRRAAEIDNLKFTITPEIDKFWEMLNNCLEQRHRVAPVHTAEELKLLKSRFPNNILFACLEDENGIQAGSCLYASGKVFHAQYISATEYGRQEHLLPLLFHKILEEFKDKFRYFDFGISTEAGGIILNEGLIRQKSSFGGSAVVFDRYFLEL